MPLKEIQKIITDTKGLLADVEGELLFNLAKMCSGKGVIVEIGSWTGASTVCLAKGSKEGKQAKIYAIDPHTGILNSSEDLIENKDALTTFEEFQKNIKNAQVDDIIVPFVKTSEEAAKDFNKHVELIFIDGDHSYEATKLDFDLWFPKVVNGGIMAFHDSVGVGFLGPKKVVSDMVYKSKYFRNIGTMHTITFAQKVEINTLNDRIENRYKLFSKNFYILGSTLRLPKPIKTIGKKIIAKLLNYQNANR
jgi:predicted O-methyltransferase YrrM